MNKRSLPITCSLQLFLFCFINTSINPSSSSALCYIQGWNIIHLPLPYSFTHVVPLLTFALQVVWVVKDILASFELYTPPNPTKWQKEEREYGGVGTHLKRMGGMCGLGLEWKGENCMYDTWYEKGNPSLSMKISLSYTWVYCILKRGIV